MQAHTESAALITGGGQGLGMAIACQLVAEGCTRLTIADRNAEAGRAAAKALSQDGVSAWFLHVDMSETEAAIAMVDQAAERMGGLNALVNCAADTSRGSILDTSPELWHLIMDTNVTGPFFALQRFAKRVIKADHSASVVNILSVVVHCGSPSLAPYSASKAAMWNVTKNAANALSKHRIRVNAINGGWMDTPGEDAVQKKFHGRSEGWQREAEASLPLGHLVKPEQVARQVSFLLGRLSGVVTGSVMDFDQVVVGAPNPSHNGPE